MSGTLKKWLLVAVLVIVAIPILFIGGRALAGSGNKAAALQTDQVTRGDIQAQVLSSASLQPAADLTLTFGSAGSINALNVKPGDKVQKGQALASLDTSDLNLAVVQAQANVSSAQAKLDSVKEGSAAKDIANAEDTLKAAQAKYNSLNQGPTSSDLANAEANLASAKAKLASVLAGPNPQDVANAQSALVSAQAKLDALKVGPTPQDLANAQSALTSAQAKLDALKAPPAPGDVAAAVANLKSAQDKLAALKAGPTTAQISAAQLKVTQAQTNLTKTQSSSSLAKQSAEIALNQAANAVRDAQDKVSEASMINVPRKGSEHLINPDGSYNVDATQTQIDTYNAAVRAEQDAEANMHKAQLSLTDAQQAEIQNDAAAQAQLDDANKQLADLTAGPTAADLTAAEAAVSTAQNNLDKLNAPPAPADLAAAQSAVDQARNNLDKLKAPPTATDLAQAQAAVDQAQNNLTKAKAGPTDADVKAAQAGVTSAQAALDKLKAPAATADVVAAQTAVDQAQNNLNALKQGPAASDVEQAQAAVDQAKANLQSAQIKLANATISAPFAGVITSVPVTLGQSVAANTVIAELVDTSSYHVDMNVGEADITRIKTGQPVDVTFDALAGQVYTGTVTYVSPVATIQQGVVSYLATVTVDPKAAGNSDLRPGMSATAADIVEQDSNVLMVPNRAVRTEGRQKVVYIVGPGGTQIRVPITTGISNDTSTEIVGDTVLREGDAVVIPSSSSTSTNRAPTGGGLINFGGARGGR